MKISLQRPFLSFSHFYGRLLCAVLTVLFFTNLKAQTPVIQWQKTLGGMRDDRIRSIQQTTDGNYILLAETESSNSGDVGTNHGYVDAWIVKLTPPCPFTPSVTGNSFINKDETLIGSATTGTFVWSSDNLSVATVSQTGIVTGIGMGAARISYVVTQGGCTAVASKDIRGIFFDPAKCYRIYNGRTGKVLTVKDASQADSTQIYQSSIYENAHQLWHFKKLADGKYTITSVGSGKLIDIQDNTPAGFCAEGTIIQQFTADGTNSQKWRIEIQPDNSFKIYNATCNKPLRVEDGSSNVGIKNDFGTDAFNWFIQEAPCAAPIYEYSCYRIINKATNKVLELKNGALTDGTQIYQWASATNRPQQLWQTTKLSDGKYIITSKSSNKVMDVLDNTTCNKYLRVESGSTADGASVGIKNDFGSDAFKWYFQAANCSTGVVLSATNATFGFEARAAEGRAKLQWLTNTGDKTDYFTVERLNTQGSFEVLDRQNAFATNDTKYYTFTDNDPLEGDNLYRINTIFNNAPPQYSEVKKVSFSKNDGVNIYPNPANDYISVDLRKYEGKTVSLYLYNAMGLLVKKQIIEKASAAPQRIDMVDFTTGSYLIRVQSEGKRDVLKQVTIAK